MQDFCRQPGKITSNIKKEQFLFPFRGYEKSVSGTLERIQCGRQVCITHTNIQKKSTHIPM